jgi:hypothetical protein
VPATVSHPSTSPSAPLGASAKQGRLSRKEREKWGTRQVIVAAKGYFRGAYRDHGSNWQRLEGIRLARPLSHSP